MQGRSAYTRQYKILGRDGISENANLQLRNSPSLYRLEATKHTVDWFIRKR